MYEVIIDGTTKNISEENLIWVRLKSESGAWIKTTEDKAEAVAINGEIYNLEGYNLVTIPKAIPSDNPENTVILNYTPAIVKITKVD